MNRRLADLSADDPDGRHAQVALDGAGLRRSKDLDIPAERRAAEVAALRPRAEPRGEGVSFLKSPHFANHVFKTAEEVEEAVESVWRAFAKARKRISFIGAREWASLS